MKTRLLFHLALGALIFSCSAGYAQDTGGGTGGGTGGSSGGNSGGSGGSGGGGGRSIDYPSLGNAQAWFGQRGGGRWNDRVIPNAGVNNAMVLRPNNIAGNTPSFIFPTGGLIAQPKNMNAMPDGNNDSNSQGIPNARDMKVMTADERLNANAKELAATSPVAQQALAKLSNAPITAGNFVVSMIARPENKKSGESVMAAAQLLVALPTSDVARLFTHPTGDVSNMQLADFYTQKLQDLAGAEPLAFSGRKLVVITAQGDSAASMRAGASQRLEIADLTPAQALEQILTGEIKNPAIQGMKNTAIQVLAQQDSSIWLHTTAGSVSTLPHLKTGSEGLKSATNPSEQLLARATIVYSGDAGVQAVQVPTASRAGLSLTLADLQQTALDQPTLSDIECIAEAAHPQMLVAAVKNSADASSALTKLKANPWYGQNASYLVLLQQEKGTELLLY